MQGHQLSVSCHSRTSTERSRAGNAFCTRTQTSLTSVNRYKANCYIQTVAILAGCWHANNFKIFAFNPAQLSALCLCCCWKLWEWYYGSI